MRMQASLLSTAALTAQVDVLKKDLGRTEQELGLAKRQLEEEEGKKYLKRKRKRKKRCLQRGLIAERNNRIELLIVGATTEVATLKQALAEAGKKTAEERVERERLGVQVGEVQQELQALMKKHESLELESKAQASELASAIESAKNAKAEAQKALQEFGKVKKVAAGKAFSMQSKNIKVNYLLLT